VLTGTIAEGWGSRARRGAIRVVGFTALAAIGIVVAVWRTAEIRELPFFSAAVEFFRSG
jgi:hypothetical protein